MAEKVLVRSLVEIETELAVELLVALELELADDGDVAGVELLLELELLQAATSNAAETAAAVSPAVFVTEYNGVPRLFRSRHAHQGMCEIRSVWPDLC
jgi:hypothetical protein